MYYYEKKWGYKYPKRSDEHMLEVKKCRSVTIDENYPYYNKSFKYKCLRSFFWLLLNPLVLWVVSLHHGLRIFGKKQFRRNKRLFKDGAITICNHVFLWDYLCVLKAIRPHLQRFPAWKTNYEGPNGGLIHMAGGVPVPTDNMAAMVKFKKAIDEILNDKKWVHFFPEGSMWYFYPDIRPLKPAVFKFAVEHNKPIIPMAISFRKRRGIFRLFGRKPCADLHIGEPLLPDLTLSKVEAIDKLHKEAYHVMQLMVGVSPGDKTYNSNQNIDDYKSTI